MVDKEPSCKAELTSPFFASTKPKPTLTFSSAGMPVLGGINLVSIHELPDRLRPIFPFEVFNRMQSKCFEIAYKSDDNLVVSAPTASGKTAVLEMAICRLLRNADIVNTKIVYIGSTKALCEERHRDWSSRFHQLGLMCKLLTGDTEGNQQEILKKSQLIITTPEKWDSITRKNQDQDRLMQLVRLLLIDEVHILKEERGATVEAVVSRMKSSGKTVRFIALSATIPNADDIAAWLGANNLNPDRPARLESFGEEYRPSRLYKHVEPIPCKDDTNDFCLDRHCNAMLTDIIAKYGASKPILIFCSTKKSTESAANSLAEYWKKNKNLWPQPARMLPLKSKLSRTLAAAGIAFHHAGLETDERKAIEEAYHNRDLSIICCTSTLAVGINLPCYLVIIKNTMSYNGQHGLQEYSDLDIMQMLGRAGRPQFGDHGVGVIITKPSKVEKYERLAHGQELLESHLHKNLIEHLNAEVALGTIRSVEDAKRWLTSTFLYVRLQRNRRHYKIDGIPSDADVGDILEHLCISNIDTLRGSGIVEMNQFKCSKFGELMAQQNIRLKTMINFKNMHYGAKVSEIVSRVQTSWLCSNSTACNVGDCRGTSISKIKTGRDRLVQQVEPTPNFEVSCR